MAAAAAAAAADVTHTEVTRLGEGDLAENASPNLKRRAAMLLVCCVMLFDIAQVQLLVSQVAQQTAESGSGCRVGSLVVALFRSKNGS